MREKRVSRWVFWSGAAIVLLAVCSAVGLYLYRAQGRALPPDQSRAVLAGLVGGTHNLPQQVQILNGWKATRSGLGYAVRFKIPPTEIEALKREAVNHAMLKHDHQESNEADDMPRGRSFHFDHLPRWWKPEEVSDADALKLTSFGGLRWVAISRETGLGYYYYGTD